MTASNRVGLAVSLDIDLNMDRVAADASHLLSADAIGRDNAAMAIRVRKTPKMTQADVVGFIDALGAVYPVDTSELDFTDAFTLLVAVVLSAQTTDVAVNRATAGLFAAAPDPVAMAALGPDGIAPHIKRLGLWQAKAKNVAALSHLLIERHEGMVPSDRASLEALPGVGRKTANVVLNVAFGEATMAVDTHVFRLGNRTGLAPGKTVRVVEDLLVKRIPHASLKPAHHWLILHGRYVCKARRPECWRCVASSWCRFPTKSPAPYSAPLSHDDTDAPP